MKKTALLTSLTLILLAFSACNNSSFGKIEEQETKSGMAYIRVTNNLRSAFTPENVSTGDITKAVLNYRNQDETKFAELKTWTPTTVDGEEISAIDQMQSDTDLSLPLGTYDFNLELYVSNEKVPLSDGFAICQTGTLTDIQLTEGVNTLEFQTSYAADGTGSFSFKYNLPETSKVDGVKISIYKVDLTTLSAGEAVVTDEEIELTVIPDPNEPVTEPIPEPEKFASYSNPELENGLYKLVITPYYDNATTADQAPITEYFRVASGCTTSGEITLSMENLNTPYSINYNMNGGEWVTGFTETTTRLAQEAVLLPTGEQIERNGLTFLGWYESETFLEDSRTETIDATEDNARDIELWAKWGTRSAPANGNAVFNDYGINLSLSTYSVNGNNPGITLIAEEIKTGNTISESVHFTAEILHKGKDVNELAYEYSPFYTQEGQFINFTSDPLDNYKRLLPNGTYQLFATATYKDFTSSATFDIRVEFIALDISVSSNLEINAANKTIGIAVDCEDPSVNISEVSLNAKLLSEEGELVDNNYYTLTGSTLAFTSYEGNYLPDGRYNLLVQAEYHGQSFEMSYTITVSLEGSSDPGTGGGTTDTDVVFSIIGDANITNDNTSFTISTEIPSLEVTNSDIELSVKIFEYDSTTEVNSSWYTLNYRTVRFETNDEGEYLIHNGSYEIEMTGTYNGKSNSCKYGFTVNFEEGSSGGGSDPTEFDEFGTTFTLNLSVVNEDDPTASLSYLFENNILNEITADMALNNNHYYPIEISGPGVQSQKDGEEFITEGSIYRIANILKLTGYSERIDLNLSEVTGIETIVTGEFTDNLDLYNLLLPNSVKTIEANAFGKGNYNMQIILPSSLENVSGQSFGEIQFGNGTFYIDEGNLLFKTNGYGFLVSKDGTTLVASRWTSDTYKQSISDYCLEGITKIADYAFYHNTGISALDLSDTATTEIGAHAFEGCTNLESLNLDSVTTIKDYAFANCTSLKGELNLQTVTAIYPHAFELTQGEEISRTITIADNVRLLGTGAFYAAGENSQTISGLTDSSITWFYLKNSDQDFESIVLAATNGTPTTISDLLTETNSRFTNGVLETFSINDLNNYFTDNTGDYSLIGVGN